MMRPLPDIDLARIAPQPDDQKRRSLEQMKGGYSPFSYKPVRACFDDIFNVQPALEFGEAKPTSWIRIRKEVRKRSGSDDEFRHNKMVAKALHDFAMSGRMVARRHEFFPLAMGVGRKVSLWLPMIVGIDEQPHAIFIDPRRTRGLTKEGRRFAFSMMHERIRMADEDFADVGLAVVRLSDPIDGERSVRKFTDEGVNLFSLAELESLVARTYEIWGEVLAERERDIRHQPAVVGTLI